MYVVHVERPQGAAPIEISVDEHDVGKAIRVGLTKALGGGATFQFDKEPSLLDTDYFALITKLEGFELVTDSFRTKVRASLCPETRMRIDQQMAELEAQLGGEKLAEPLRAQLVSFWLRSAA